MYLVENKKYDWTKSKSKMLNTCVKYCTKQFEELMSHAAALMGYMTSKKCDNHTDALTDAGQSDPYKALY